MSYRRPGQAKPPVWIVILTAAMLVFGGYFIWQGVKRYMGSSFQGFAQATERVVSTPTANIPPTRDARFTLAPSRTPVPACQEFLVIVPEAIIRECASTRCAIAATRREGETVCVLEREYGADDWYIVDLDDSQFFSTIAYMHESLLRPMNPTPTPSVTNTLLPTLTPLPSSTYTPTPLAVTPSDPSIPTS